MGLFNWFKKKKDPSKPNEEPKTVPEEKFIDEAIKEDSESTKAENNEVSETEEKKTRKEIYHVTQHPDGWKVKKSGGKRAIKVFRTQSEAIDYAKHLAETHDTSFVIHKKDGSIRKQKY
jgi:uncharacterized protein YdaT